MDRIDAILLELLQRDCSQSYARLAQQVGLSVTPVVQRLKRLRAQGHIRAHVALVDARSVGLRTCAFVSVMIERPAAEAAFVKRMCGLPAVQECHVTSGEYSVLLKLRVADTQALERFLAGSVRKQKGVTRVRVDIALDTPKETQTVPVAAAG